MVEYTHFNIEFPNYNSNRYNIPIEDNISNKKIRFCNSSKIHV